MYTSRVIVAVCVFFVFGEAFRKKSSKTDAELEAGSFVETEANTKAGKRAQTLKDMKALAHKVVAGEEKIYPETLKALKEVEWVIQVAENETRPQWREHQDELDDAKQMFDDCKAEYISKALEINKTEGKRIGELTNIHDESRSSEKKALDNKGRTCETFEEYNDEVNLPGCASHVFDFLHECNFSARSSCIDELVNWSNDHIPKYHEKKIACYEAWAKHKNASETATKNQNDLEFGLCRWGVQLNDVCKNYLRGCWDTALRNREEVHPRIVVSEKALKAEYFAIQKIKCYVNVLKAEEQDRVDELKKCEDLEYNDLLKKTANHTLSNTYHPIPDEPECLKVHGPCDAEWRKTYFDQSWSKGEVGPPRPFCGVFPNGTEKVKPSSCSQKCPLPPVIHGCYASVYQHVKFRGNVATFSVGEYKRDEFVNRGPLRNNHASSIKVQGPPGCKATLYEKDNFEGWHAEFKLGEYDLPDTKNDQASSIKVTLG